MGKGKKWVKGGRGGTAFRPWLSSGGVKRSNDAANNNASCRRKWVRCVKGKSEKGKKSGKEGEQWLSRGTDKRSKQRQIVIRISSPGIASKLCHVIR